MIKKIFLSATLVTIMIPLFTLAASSLFDTAEFTRIQNLAKSDTATEAELRAAARQMEDEAFEADDYARRDKAILDSVPFNDPNGLTYKDREDSYKGYLESARIRRELASTFNSKAEAAFNKEAVAAMEAEAAQCEADIAALEKKSSLTAEESEYLQYCRDKATELRKQAAELKGGKAPSVNFKLIVPIPCLKLGVEKCATASETNPLKYIATLYNFGIGLGLLVAMAVIVFAGLRWATSAGNVTATADARDMIINAVLGVVMLLGATMILRIISPDLANLKLDALEPLKQRSFEFGDLDALNKAYRESAKQWTAANQDYKSARAKADALAKACEDKGDKCSKEERVAAKQAQLDAQVKLVELKKENVEHLQALLQVKKAEYEQALNNTNSTAIQACKFYGIDSWTCTEAGKTAVLAEASMGNAQEAYDPAVSEYKSELAKQKQLQAELDALK